MRPDVAAQKELAEVELARDVHGAARGAIASEGPAITGGREQRRAEAELQPLAVGFPSLDAHIEPKIANCDRRITDAATANALTLRIVAVNIEQVDRQRQP